MKELPAFTDFLKSIDQEKFGYDVELFLRMRGYKGSRLFSQSEQEDILHFTAATFLAFLQDYHIWLCEQLRKEEEQYPQG